MQRRIEFGAPGLPEGFRWLNPPAIYQLGNGLELHTDKATDFWQRTHYGFRRDNGHALFTTLAGDFSITTRVQFQPRGQYDQCGLMVRVDAENWIKLSMEYENPQQSRLGSVVTNLGYSDWATQDVSSERVEMLYRITREADDFLLEQSGDGQGWQQLRVAHLHRATESIDAGVYACSPVGAAFWCRFQFVELGGALGQRPATVHAPGG